MPDKHKPAKPAMTSKEEKRKSEEILSPPLSSIGERGSRESRQNPLKPKVSVPAYVRW